MVIHVIDYKNKFYLLVLLVFKYILYIARNVALIHYAKIAHYLHIYTVLALQFQIMLYCRFFLVFRLSVLTSVRISVILKELAVAAC